MLFFLILMCVGLVGLVGMALPGVFRHGGGHSVHGGGHSVHGGGHGAHLGHHASLSHGHTAAHPVHAHGHPSSGHAASGSKGGQGLAHFLPEPRLVLSVLALYGAFGNVLERVFQFPFWVSALVALLPALLVERLVLGPLWRLALEFQGRPSSPLGALVLEEARAVTAFRNGRGLVEVIRDGRSVQLSARLVE
ncbi:MAG: hypothetical protein ACXU86_20295, partial [Archangium sp.]